MERPAARCIVGRARYGSAKPDRIGPGAGRRTIRLLPDHAAGRVPDDRRGFAKVGLSSHPVPSLCRRPGGPGGRRVDPGRTELADRSRPDQRRGPQTSRSEPERTNSFPSTSPGMSLRLADGKPADRYAIVWAEKTGPDDDARMVASIAASELEKVHGGFKNAGMAPMALSGFRGTDGRTSYSGIWHKSATSASAVFRHDLGERKVSDELVQHAAVTLVDMSVGVAAACHNKRTCHRRVAKGGSVTEGETGRPGRPICAGESPISSSATTTRRSTISTPCQAGPATRQCCSVPGHRPCPARSQGGSQGGPGPVPEERLGSKHQALSAVIVAAELGEGADQAFEKLEAALKSQPKDLDLAYNAACAYALASQALGRKDQAKSQTAGGAGHWLAQGGDRQRLLRFQPHAGGRRPRPDPGLPAFAEIMKAGHLDRRLRRRLEGRCRSRGDPDLRSRSGRSSQALPGTGAQGYRLVSLSVARTSPDGPPVTASVWHRPVVSEEAKDRLAERQARAAVALVRLGQAEGGLAALAAQCRPPAAQLHRQLAQSPGCRPEAVAASSTGLSHPAGDGVLPLAPPRGRGWPEAG